MTDRPDLPAIAAAPAAPQSSGPGVLVECAVCVALTIGLGALAIAVAAIVPWVEMSHALCATGVAVIAMGILAGMREG